MIHHIYPGESELAARSRLFGLLRKRAIAIGGNAPAQIYGRLDCKSGRRMKSSNRVFFADEADAIAAGYRPCAHCMPEAYRKWKNEQHDKKQATT